MECDFSGRRWNMVVEKTFIVIVFWYVFLRSWRGASHNKDERRDREDVKGSGLH